MFTGAPLGSTPLGLPEPVEAPEPPEKSTLSRFLDPATRDYVVDPATRGLAQMPGTRQRVLIILLTELGTSTVLGTMGVKFNGRLDRTFPARARAQVARALKPVVDDGSARVLRIDVERTSSGRARVTVEFVDLRTNQPDQAQTVI